jgi:hydrogenase maturation protease
MAPVAVLRAVRAMGGRTDHVLLVGCEPEDFGGDEGRMELSPTVGAVVDEACELVASIVARRSAEAGA